MNKNERQKAIRVKLVRDKNIYVSELAKELSVATRTIGNDLKQFSLLAAGDKMISIGLGANETFIQNDILFDLYYYPKL